MKTLWKNGDTYAVLAVVLILVGIVVPMADGAVLALAFLAVCAMVIAWWLMLRGKSGNDDLTRARVRERQSDILRPACDSQRCAERSATTRRCDGVLSITEDESGVYVATCMPTQHFTLHKRPGWRWDPIAREVRDRNGVLMAYWRESRFCPGFDVHPLAYLTEHEKPAESERQWVESWVRRAEQAGRARKIEVRT